MTNPTAIEFIDLAEVERRVGLKKTAVYRAVREARFPRPVNVTPKSVRWAVAEIEQWQRERLAERDRAA